MRTTATRLCLVVSLVAAVALASVPVANAAQRGFNLKGATAHHRDDAQNKKIKKANRNAKRAHRRIAALKEWNESLNDWNQSQETTLRSLESTVGTIIAGVPAIVGGLQTIQSVLEDQVGPGLLALEAGLRSLADFVTADEYGIMQVTTSAPGDPGGAQTAVPGCFYQTPNIPDNVQGAYMTGQCLMSGVGAGRIIHFMAGVRSNENDGTPSRGPVAVAGVVAYEQMSAACAGTPCAILAGGGATGPNAGLGGAPAVPIPSRSQMTNTSETSFPFGPVSTDNLVNLTQDATFTGTPADPTQAAAGNPIRFTIRFVDISADAEKTGE
jgi:hypothetical protein